MLPLIAADRKWNPCLPVVEAGGAAAGEVSLAAKRGPTGKPAEIGISVRSVTAADGTMIPAPAQKVVRGEDRQTEALIISLALCILGLPMKGGDAYIAEGTYIKALTVANVDMKMH